LQWEPRDAAQDPQIELFSRFRALPEPRVPRPGQSVALELDWPEDAEVRSLRLRFQTSIDGPWIDVPQTWNGKAPQTVVLGTFDRDTPVSYRLDTKLAKGATAELWGYFQVREDPKLAPQPIALPPDSIVCEDAADAVVDVAALPKNEVDLLALSDPKTCWTTGEWSNDMGKLLGPKRYGARLQIPYSPPEEYRLVAIVEPLDKPNGLILGQRSGAHRFVTLLNYTPGQEGKSALENVDGRNVGNETTFTGNVFRKDRLSQVIVTVRRADVTVSVDGRTILSWRGSPDRLSLSDYWKTPDPTALFVGAYDCRYRFHRLSLETLSGDGRRLSQKTLKRTNKKTGRADETGET